MWQWILFFVSISQFCYSLQLSLIQFKKPTSAWSAWESCPAGSAVIGMKLMLSNHTPDTLKGIMLSCNAKNKTIDESPVITAAAQGVNGVYRMWKECPDGGMAVGIQKKVSENIYRSVEINATANEIKILDSWKLGMVEVLLYCENLRQAAQLDDISANMFISPSNWMRPVLCGWGEFICAIRAQFSGPRQDKMINVQIKCCSRFEASDIHWKTNRMRGGRILQSYVTPQRVTFLTTGRVYNDHFVQDLDSPYFYKWNFCSPGQYVIGMQLQFGKRGLGLLCVDVSRPKPRMPEIIQMNGGTEAWELSGDDLSQQIECEGVMIGFQVKYYEKYGIQAIRLICSFTSGPPNKLAYVESRFRNLNSVAAQDDGKWQGAELCGRNQAVCGFKAYTHTFGEHKNLLEHIKVKCCAVPEIAEVCFPSDKYELLVECDATQAMADTICTYIQSEGISIANTRTESQIRDVEFHQILGREWSITLGQNEIDSSVISKELTTSNKTGITSTDSVNIQEGSSNAIGNEATISNGTTDATTKGTGTNRKVEISETDSQGGEFGRTNVLKHGLSRNVGEGKSVTTGRSKAFTASMTKVTGQGVMEETSESLTEGVSTGTLKAQMRGNSDSLSSSYTKGASNSDSHSLNQRDTSTSSTTHGWNVKLGYEAEAEANFGFVSAKVKTSFEAGYSGSITYGSESSRESSRSTASEVSQTDSRAKSSETQTQHTNQNTKEETSSGNKGNLKQTRKDEGETKGTEESKGFTAEARNEITRQTSQNVEEEESNAETRKVTAEKTKAESLDVNKEESKAETAERRAETKDTRLLTENKEISKGKSLESNTEIGSQLATGMTKEKSHESSKLNTNSGTANRGKKFVTGFDWGKASTSTWNLQRSTEVRMLVPAGIKTQLFQAVGHCAYYTVKTSFYKRIDTSPFRDVSSRTLHIDNKDGIRFEY